MMNNITENNLEFFIDTIESESSNRKMQLSYLSDMLQRINDDTYKVTFMKITITELYAQYEGFFKFIFLETINHIKKLQINNGEINQRYIIFPLLTHLTKNITKQKTKAKKIIDIFDNIFIENKKYLDISNIEEYILNLDSTKHTLNILGINSNTLPMRELDLLYNRRCEIAHGNISEANPFNTSPHLEISDSVVRETYRFWKEHYECVLSTIDLLSELFINYISNEEYKIACL